MGGRRGEWGARVRDEKSPFMLLFLETDTDDSGECWFELGSWAGWLSPGLG